MQNLLLNKPPPTPTHFPSQLIVDSTCTLTVYTHCVSTLERNSFSSYKCLKRKKFELLLLKLRRLKKMVLVAKQSCFTVKEYEHTEKSLCWWRCWHQTFQMLSSCLLLLALMAFFSSYELMNEWTLSGGVSEAFFLIHYSLMSLISTYVSISIMAGGGGSVCVLGGWFGKFEMWFSPCISFSPFQPSIPLIPSLPFSPSCHSCPSPLLCNLLQLPPPSPSNPVWQTGCPHLVTISDIQYVWLGDHPLCVHCALC